MSIKAQLTARPLLRSGPRQARRRPYSRYECYLCDHRVGLTGILKEYVSKFPKMLGMIVITAAKSTTAGAVCGPTSNLL